MHDDEQELNKLLQKASQSTRVYSVPRAIYGDQSDPDEESASYGKMCQFTTGDGIRFFPSGSTTPRLTPGTYEIKASPTRGLYFEKIETKTEGLIRFPDSNSDKVVEEITKFWTQEPVYDKYRLLYRRGIILWGPPGSGKSSTIRIIVNDVVQRKGVVFKFGEPHLFSQGARSFREIQPDTPVVVLMEDIDSILDMYSESEVLNILDGVGEFRKVVFLATTNYPEDLGARIMNRPSRFDSRHKMGHPKPAARKLYFEHLIDAETQKQFKIDIKQWAKDTDGLSIAHLKELFVSHVIMGNKYEDAIETLRSMKEDRPKSGDDEEGSIGF